jgi:hypothetical protein
MAAHYSHKIGFVVRQESSAPSGDVVKFRQARGHAKAIARSRLVKDVIPNSSFLTVLSSVFLRPAGRD